MMGSRRWVMMAAPAIAGVVGLFSLAAGGKTAGAADADVAAARERCAMRLSVAFLGKTPSAELLASLDPQSQVDTMLTTPDFMERFARFTNATMNRDPGQNAQEDSAYWLSKYVLQNGKPWSDLFLGAYKVDANSQGQVTVSDDPNGLGYFRSRPWLVRYAGNEPTGLKIVSAFRIMNNVIGLQLVASTNAPGADVSATGRQQQPCRGCHYDNWFALDKVASILTTRTKDGQGNTQFGAQPQPQADILGGQSIHDDKELVTALVASENFAFNACRTAFQFLYGRAENQCEGPVFDRCMETFKAQKTIQSALATVAKDAGYCQ